MRLRRSEPSASSLSKAKPQAAELKVGGTGHGGSLVMIPRRRPFATKKFDHRARRIYIMRERPGSGRLAIPNVESDCGTSDRHQSRRRRQAVRPVRQDGRDRPGPQQPDLLARHGGFRRHAEIALNGDGTYTLRDVGQRQWARSSIPAPFRDAILRSGDHLQIGQTILVFSAGGRESPDAREFPAGGAINWTNGFLPAAPGGSDPAAARADRRSLPGQADRLVVRDRNSRAGRGDEPQPHRTAPRR